MRRPDNSEHPIQRAIDLLKNFIPDDAHVYYQAMSFVVGEEACSKSERG